MSSAHFSVRFYMPAEGMPDYTTKPADVVEEIPAEPARLAEWGERRDEYGYLAWWHWEPGFWQWQYFIPNGATGILRGPLGLKQWMWVRGRWTARVSRNRMTDALIWRDVQ